MRFYVSCSCYIQKSCGPLTPSIHVGDEGERCVLLHQHLPAWKPELENFVSCCIEGTVQQQVWLTAEGTRSTPKSLRYPDFILALGFCNIRRGRICKSDRSQVFISLDAYFSSLTSAAFAFPSPLSGIVSNHTRLKLLFKFLLPSCVQLEL